MGSKDYLDQLIDETLELALAVMEICEEAQQRVGYHHFYEFAPGLWASYELFEWGPDRACFNHNGPYEPWNEEKQFYGKRLDPAKVDEDALLRSKKRPHARLMISVDEQGSRKPVCAMEGVETLSMSLCTEGDWKETVRKRYRDSQRKGKGKGIAGKQPVNSGAIAIESRS